MSLLQKRVDAGAPVTVGLIGCGKFGSMFLSQVPTIKGLEVVAIADLSPDRAKKTCEITGWDPSMIADCHYTDNAEALCARADVEVIIEATGDPIAGIRHALAAIEHHKHIVMVNVEADVLAGVVLSRHADAAGVVYSMAYGDQPALVSEMVDWARASGFKVTAAGKGTRYLPMYHEVTPDDVWEHYGLNAEEAEAAGMNPQMFNSFLDGTKSAIEMAAISNACDLIVPANGLLFPPCDVDELAQTLKPVDKGGVLAASGMVEVISSLERDGNAVRRDLRWGVYVVLEAPNDYAAACFKQYGLATDSTGQFAAQYKPYHLIGLELSISVLSASLRGEPTGQSRSFNGDVVATAKKDLNAGDSLDGEGGYTVWGRLLPSAKSVAMGALPIGLASNVILSKPVSRGQTVTYSHVQKIPKNAAVSLRGEMELSLQT